MMELEREQDKEVESYPRVLSVTVNSPIANKGKDKRSISTQKTQGTKENNAARYTKKTMESKKAHVKNLSDYDLTGNEINLQFCQGDSITFLHP